MADKFIIGIDLGGTNLKVALLDSKYRIRNKKVLHTKRFTQKRDLIRAILASIDVLLAENKLNRKNILGIGLGLPGPIDTKQGIVHFFPNIPGWKEVRLKAILETRLRLPVFLDNDANLMSLAEYRLGAGKGLRNVVCITLGTGVGGGLIIEGNLYRGTSFAAGEIGHIPVNEAGPQCNCGGTACIETYVGNNRILKQARKIFKREVSLEEISSLAKKQNKLAIQLWSSIGRHLGIMLVGVVNLLNPDALVIGGGVAGAGKILFDTIKGVIKKQAMYVQGRHVKLVRAKLGNEAGLIGAAILAKEGVGL